MNAVNYLTEQANQRRLGPSRPGGKVGFAGLIRIVGRGAFAGRNQRRRVPDAKRFNPAAYEARSMKRIGTFLDRLFSTVH